ncbi:hypothetical protein Sjap_011906 [Stephania japonica]|uniref:Uncharacterized protein n=1 Tax=Stephania japonica TaxID=461633 RepID=A0AAP0JCG5_9MAGN
MRKNNGKMLLTCQWLRAQKPPWVPSAMLMRFFKFSVWFKELTKQTIENRMEVAGLHDKAFAGVARYFHENVLLMFLLLLRATVYLLQLLVVYNGVEVVAPFNLDILKWANETHRLLSYAKLWKRTSTYSETKQILSIRLNTFALMAMELFLLNQPRQMALRPWQELESLVITTEAAI